MNKFEEAVSMIDERTGLSNDENVFEMGETDIIDYAPNKRNLCTATLTRVKWRNKILELAKLHPDEVNIICQNKDGSIVAHFPRDYIHINRPRSLSPEEKERLSVLARKNFHKG